MHKNREQPRRHLPTEIKKHKYLFLLLLPGIVWYAIFCYAPMYGNIIAFKDYKFNMGIMGSPWAGFRHFERLFRDPDFLRIFKNQIIISFMMLFTSFPFTILLSLILNDVRRSASKRFYQTVFTFPHFLSWVVVSSVFFNLLSSEGIVNQVLGCLGLEKQNILMNPEGFRGFLYIGNIWKEAGWGTIIYLAALTGIDTQLYDATAVDGANKWQQLRYVTWPGIKSTAAVMLILAVGGIMSTGFDQILNLYNQSVYSVADILDTYVYRIGIQKGSNFGYTAAIGLFKSVINLLLLAIANKSVKLCGEDGIL